MLLLETGKIYLNNMKLNFSFLLILVAVSCASIDRSKIAPGYIEAFNSIKNFLIGYQNQIEPELIENIPYASMLVKIGNGPTALMILENISEEGHLWVSADGVYLLIKSGRIIKTYGLPNNLTSRLSSFRGWDKILQGSPSFSYISYSEPVLNNLKVQSVFTSLGQEKIPLMFGTKQLNLIEETVESEKIGWSGTNKFWLDESNFVWKSVQHLSPRLPEFYIEVTKKPR